MCLCFSKRAHIPRHTPNLSRTLPAFGFLLTVTAWRCTIQRLRSSRSWKSSKVRDAQCYLESSIATERIFHADSWHASHTSNSTWLMPCISETSNPNEKTNKIKKGTGTEFMFSIIRPNERKKKKVLRYVARFVIISRYVITLYFAWSIQNASRKATGSQTTWDSSANLPSSLFWLVSTLLATLLSSICKRTFACSNFSVFVFVFFLALFTALGSIWRLEVTTNAYASGTLRLETSMPRNRTHAWLHLRLRITGTA